MSAKNSPQNKEEHAPEPEDSDAVLEASIESFPASDPPTWTPVQGPNAKATPVEHGRKTKNQEELTAINAIIAEQWQTVAQSSFCGRRPWIMCIRMFACITLLGALLPMAGYTANPVSDKASNITPADTRTPIAPELPPPPVPDNASPLDFLHAARNALAHGKAGQAQEALERAEARALDRAVPPFQTDKPIEDPLVAQIRQARLALASNDIQRSIQLIASATDTATHLASSQ